MSTSETKEMTGKHREKERGGTFHRVAYFLLRMSELVCAVIVLAILARFTYLVGIARVDVQGRIVYALVIASIATAFSILFCLPINALSMSFPFDFILFVGWLVAFSLLASESRHCSSGWYNNYWGYYWGRWWRTGPVGTVAVGNTGCGYWRTTLAFSFLASMAHLLSFILGIYVFRTYVRVKDTVATAKRQAGKLRKYVIHPSQRYRQQILTISTKIAFCHPPREWDQQSDLNAARDRWDGQSANVDSPSRPCSAVDDLLSELLLHD
ncbi:uncharacterized protein J7T54_005579 [Emericellopsis cladophorae]|uniref:MARVEL domain-containing protein n=1 Tax=Emericellopsis cladophorae TaxID=2686198 RepID=A0A9P9Y567_9HYPO|nr:uncharacterized protein J7T54_005579 [Emericellopsis cladophorae]KAI6783550.1 hypothetical protein J7T54_005579 [Emericellopsis cladophorae]